ncbi:hypothetical protein MASR2M8_13250 [Opitutaceae bacterium]
MSGVKQVEHAVGQDELLPGGAQTLPLEHGLIERQKLRIFKRGNHRWIQMNTDWDQPGNLSLCEAQRAPANHANRREFNPGNHEIHQTHEKES